MYRVGTVYTNRTREVLHVEGLSGIVVARFGSPGKVAGILLGIRGRLHCIGAMQRGFFYRFGARAIHPARGYWDSVFGVRTRVGIVELMLPWGMRDEVIPVRFRPSWIHGSLHFQRSGCISFIVTACDPEIFAPAVPGSYEESEKSVYVQPIGEEWD